MLTRKTLATVVLTLPVSAATVLTGAGVADAALGADVGSAEMAGTHNVPTTGSDATGPRTDRELDLRLHDADRYIGERHTVYGLLYSDAATWTLAFVSSEPVDFYTVSGTRVLLTGPASRTIAPGDVFTGTITIAGKDYTGDPVVSLDEASIVDHRSREPLH